MTEISVGKRFRSYDEFCTFLKNYESKKYVKFYKRDSRRIEAAKVMIDFELSPDIVYSELRYCCIRGGPHRPKGTGFKKTSTFRMNCPAHIYLRATKGGMFLEVKSFSEEHNHEISKDLFERLPQVRKLPEDVKAQAKMLLSLKADKYLVQKKLQQETGKWVTLRDLSNIAAWTPKPKSVAHKRQSALSLTNDIVNVISELNVDKFERILQILKVVKECVEQDKTFGVVLSNAAEIDTMQDLIFPGSDYVERCEDMDNEEGNSLNSIEDFGQGSSDISALPSCSEQGIQRNTSLLQIASGSTTVVDGAFADTKLTESQMVVESPDSFESEGPSKRCGQAESASSKKRKTDPVPFCRLKTKEKELEILKCFVSAERASSAHVELIREEEVQVGPEDVSNKIVDSRVNLIWVKKYFTESAWDIVQQIFTLKSNCIDWDCAVCHEKLHESTLACCDYCLEWSHLSCVGLMKRPKTYWMCEECEGKL